MAQAATGGIRIEYEVMGEGDPLFLIMGVGAQLVVWPDGFCHALAEAGFSPTFGARPLRRTVQRFVANPLSQKLIAGEIADGGSVKVDYRGGEFVFEVASGARSD